MNTVMIQLSVFGSFGSIVPESENLISLMKSLKGFIPGSLKSLSINALSGQIESANRIQMANSESGWRIDFQVDRTDVIYSKPISQDGLEFLEGQVAEGLDILSKAFDAISIIPEFSRLAINAQFVKVTGKEKPKIPFITSLPSYIESDKGIKEWNITLNRAGNVTIDSEEKTNELLTCSLAHAATDPSQNAILFTLDINTIAENTTRRFSIEQYKTFLDYGIQRMDTMLNDFREK